MIERKRSPRASAQGDRANQADRSATRPRARAGDDTAGPPERDGGSRARAGDDTASPPERDGGGRPSLLPRTDSYDPACTRCPRLAEFLAESHHRYPEYWCRPVPSFGAEHPHILIVGLAPGLHGANRTGRPFTGDYAGILLYETLYELELSERAQSVAMNDGLRLRNVRIANAVKCVPPQNKPLPEEIRRCNGYLQIELRQLDCVRVILALGRIAHESVLLALGLKRAQFPFAHAREHVIEPSRVLIDSYHCSRYNTQTRVLTADMFKQVVARACELAGLA